MNEAVADTIASYAFLISVISVLLAVGGVIIAVIVHASSKKSEVETARIGFMYNLMQSSVGMGDARRLRSDGQPGYESFVPSQIVALAALRSFPELLPVLERLEPNFRARADRDPEDRNYDKTLYQELLITLKYLKDKK